MDFKSFVKDNFKGGQLYTFVGGGGKSTSIWAVAGELKGLGYRVRIGTTTKIGVEEFVEYPLRISKTLEVFKKNIFSNESVLRIVSGWWKVKEKYFGFPEAWWDALSIPSDMIILIEGDGAKRKPIKVPKSYEPVIPKQSAGVFLVIGANIFNCPIEERNTYNFEGVKSILGNQGFYTPDSLYSLIVNGWEKVIKEFNFKVLINQGDLEDKKVMADTLGEKLFSEGHLDNYLISARDKKIFKGNEKRFIGLILAAGKSSRMGAIKGLLTLNNQTFLEREINLLSRCCKEVFVAIGHEKEQLESYLRDYPCQPIIVDNYDQGMAESLKSSVLALPESQGFFVHLCDLPLVTTETIDKLYREALINLDAIVVPIYENRQGHPVFFPEKSKSLFHQLSGDEGAKVLMSQLNRIKIEVEDAGVIEDIDTPEAYQKIGGKDD